MLIAFTETCHGQAHDGIRRGADLDRRVALAKPVISPTRDRTIRKEHHRMVVSRGQLHDLVIRPDRAVEAHRTPGADVAAGRVENALSGGGGGGHPRDEHQNQHQQRNTSRSTMKARCRGPSPNGIQTRTSSLDHHAIVPSLKPREPPWFAAAHPGSMPSDTNLYGKGSKVPGHPECSFRIAVIPPTSAASVSCPPPTRAAPRAIVRSPSAETSAGTGGTAGRR